MPRHKELTGEDIVLISEMLSEGYSRREIMQATGRGAETVRRIAAGLGYPSKDKGECAQNANAVWLFRHWNWKKPEQQKKRKTNFSTPYNYPRMRSQRGD